MTPEQETEVRRQLREKGLTEQQIEDGIERVKNGDEPCEPCGDGEEAAVFPNKPPFYLLMGEALHRAECSRIIQTATDAGWTRGTIVDGTPSRNSSVRFLTDDWLLERIRGIARHAAPLLDIAITPELLASVQIGRYLPPSEDYGWHVDHDPSRRHLEHDRKLSIVGALSDGGCLEISGVGRINLNAGDLLAFSGIVSHMAPPLDHERYTLVAWLPGPPWR